MFDLSTLGDVSELVPHAPPMLLLGRVLTATDRHLRCEVTVRGDGLFDQDGLVPAYLGIEYMAQAIAALSGLHARQRGEPAKLGFLLGTRRFETSAPSLRCGDVLEVSVTEVVKSTAGMAAFECAVEGERVSQTARLSVFEPNDPGQFLQGES